MPLTNLQILRAQACKQQGGRCFYCNRPMWTSNARVFAKQLGISRKQALALRCTAEHLIARQEGGADTPDNIVAACRACNQGRHAQPIAPSPELWLHLRQTCADYPIASSAYLEPSSTPAR